MKGIISTNKTLLEAINKKINDWMFANITGYEAGRWGVIKEHPVEKGKYILVINEDERNPLGVLSTSEKKSCVIVNDSEWFPDTN